MVAPGESGRHNGAMSLNDRPPEMITASELAEWVYSREEWHWRRLGLSAPDQTLLDAGNALHGRKEAAQRRGALAVVVGRALVFLGVIALLAALLWR